MNKIDNNKKIMDFIVQIPEFFCLEDYDDFHAIQSLKFNNYYNKYDIKYPKKYIALTIFLEGKEKQLLKEKSDLNKTFLFLKILYKEKGINLLLHKKDNLNTKEILDKINKVEYFKTPIKAVLKICEFPLMNYYLKVENNDKNHKDFDQIFSLENNNNHNFNNNIFNNNGNNNNWGNNNINIFNNQMNNQNQMNNMILALYLVNNQNIMNNNNLKKEQNLSNNNKDNDTTDRENESIKSLLFTSSYKRYFPLKGLSNVGLTCYMNSTLQCLLHIPELNDYFINKYLDQEEKLNKINKKTDTKGVLSKEYYLVVIGVCEDIIAPKSHKYNNSFSPKSFNNTLSRLNSQFAQFEANDSKDLLLYLFQAIHEELNYFGDQKIKIPKCNQLIESESYDFFMKVNNSLNLSIISYLFYGILKSITICSGCNSKLYNFQYFQFLSFPAYNYQGKQMNIYQGFKDFIKEEKMQGDNQCYCQKCKGLRDAKVNSFIFFTPPYLIINFDYGKDKKYKPSKVEFGEVIELEGFTDEKCTQKEYELIGVSSHIGKSGSSGHYIAYCKDTNKGEKGEWHEFNDSSHRKCQFNEVNSNSPYFLVYRRKDILK